MVSDHLLIFINNTSYNGYCTGNEMQAALKYRETTPLEAEPSSLQVSAVGPLRIKGSDPVKNIFFYFFFLRDRYELSE